jgi:hypothetical protein
VVPLLELSCQAPRVANKLAERASRDLNKRATDATPVLTIPPRNAESGDEMQALLWSTLAAGTLDISAAIALRGLISGVAAIRVLQSVASGLLGRDAFGGGTKTAVLGLVLHFAIMVVIVTLFYFASRSLTALTTHWLWSGLAYGVVVYLVMSFVVVPLSAFPAKLVPSVAALVEGLIVHMVCVGLPIAFIISRFSSPPA